MKYFLIAGERSGDLHGSNLVRAIREQDKEAELVGYGGDMMKEAGMQLLSHYREISFMGFLEVVQNLNKITAKIKECKSQILHQLPDKVILIDFPGFNLRIARFAKEHKIETIYYISPKIWAWKKGRIRKIRKFVDEMLVVFPFEVPFYKTLDYPVTFVGNPLVEQIEKYRSQSLEVDSGRYERVVAFLPGSRVQEVKASIAMIKQLADLYPKLVFLVAGVDNLPSELYEPLEGIENIKTYVGRTYEILGASDASITTSGTATLETALFNTPQVVCYRTSGISYSIARRVVNIKYISLVNLIADKPIVKELIQEHYNVESLSEELDLLLYNEQYIKKMLNGYEEVKELLTEKSASTNAAKIITQKL